MLNGTESKQFIPHKVALQVPYRVHPEISAENHIWTIQGEYSRYSKAAMCVQRSGDTGKSPYAGSCTYDGKYPTENQCITIYGISQREKCLDDF